MQSEIYEYFSGKFGTIKGDANVNFDNSYTKNSSNLAQILICEDEKEAQIGLNLAMICVVFMMKFAEFALF